MPTTTETEMADQSARFVRQADFVPYERLLNTPVAIIGCGAIGRQVAIQLAAIGAMKLMIIDFDEVSATNVTTQGFLAADVGKDKVDVLEENIKAIDPEIEVVKINDRWRPQMKLPEVVILCVDSISTREIIWNKIKNETRLLLDGRMLGENMRILAVDDAASAENYEKSIFPESEQMEGRCTGHATIYCAALAGSLMVHQFTRHLRGFPLDHDMSLNLLAGELLPAF